MVSETTTAFIGIGSNIGDRARYLQAAIRAMDANPNITVARCSHVYETAPEGPVKEQPYFLNGVVEVTTTMSAPRLLAHLLIIEADLGRTRTLQGGPRTLDLDLLFFGAEIISSYAPKLVVPHPRIEERAFVLVPLCDLNHDMVNPATGRTPIEALARLKQRCNAHDEMTPWPKRIHGLRLC